MLDIFNPGFGELIFHLQSHLHFTLLISYIYSIFTQLQTSFKHYTFPQRFPHFPSNLSTPADPEFGGQKKKKHFALIIRCCVESVNCSIFYFPFLCFQSVTFCVCTVQSVFSLAFCSGKQYFF